jgi:alpha-beta hydrolase superfamily lysophospholipase
MNVSFDKICTDQFRSDIKDQSSPFRQALNDNDLTNWTAQTPTQLIHSEQDEIIPFLTTQQTYNALRQRGSSRLNLVALKNGFHLPTEVLFATQSMKWFAQLRN